MTEPSEEWLDWHFNTQLRTYIDEDLPVAFLSDRVIMAKWIEVLSAAPANQKVARNSLMLLMHGHIEEFGFLRAPFTDVNNCTRDLNQVVNGYHGISLLKPRKNAKSKVNDQENRAPQRVAGGRSVRRVPSRSELEPIAEVTEPSISFSRKEVGIESDTPRTPLRPTGTVRQKIQAIEKEIAINKNTPIRDYSTRRSTNQSCRNDVRTTSPIRDVNRQSQDPHCQSRKPRVRNTTPPFEVRSTHNIHKCTHQRYCYRDTSPNQDHQRSQRWEPPCGCSHVVQKLKNCFQEASERLVNISKDDKPVLGKIRATTPPPPKSPKEVSQRGKCPSQELLVSKTRIAGGQSIPLSYQRDKTVMDLLRRQEELRRHCLDYYDFDATLKDEGPDQTSVPSKNSGFSIAACRALKRMKRWRGKPNQLKFFRTIFRGCGFESDVTGRVKALDRSFERVTLQWLRSMRRSNSSVSKVDKEQPQSLDELLDKQAYKTEYMAHVGEIRKLCEIHCRGVVPPAVLEKMYNCLEKEYEAAYEAFETLEHQLDAMVAC